MAAKIVRQPNQITLLGAPSSAAALSRGHERAPQALRAAGLVDRLKSIGYKVNDLDDGPSFLFEPDQESPRARNVSRVLQALESLKPRVELAVKSGGLPLILAGDCSMALGLIAGMRRYYRTVSLIYMDRDADLNVPATTPSGCVDGMVVSHLTGRGAAEMVRFWGEPPLVRDPDLALFGVDRLDPPEEKALSAFPIRHYLAADVMRMGPARAAEQAIEKIHGNTNEFALHLDVDVISDFRATNYPGTGGLSLDDVRDVLTVFAQQKHLAAIEVAAYNPELDADGSGAKTIIDLLAEALEHRLKALAGTPAESVVVDAGPVPDQPAVPAVPADPTAGVTPGNAWSSESLEDEIVPNLSEGASPESGEDSEEPRS